MTSANSDSPPLTASQQIAADALDDEFDLLLGKLLERAGRRAPRSTADLDLMVARHQAQDRVLAEVLAWRRAEPTPTTAWEGHPLHALMCAADALIALESPAPSGRPESVQEAGG